MEWIEFLNNIIQITIVPILLLILLWKRQWIIEIMKTISAQFSTFKGAKIELFGQKLELESDANLKKSANIFEMDLKNFFQTSLAQAQFHM